MGQPELAPAGPMRVDRYLIHDEIAAGGMATVHLGRLVGEGGFSRTVAIKRLHPQYARDHEFVKMLLDEAHLAARIRHPNVVTTLDVVSSDGELLVVMEYVHGEPLSRLMRTSNRRKEPIPCAVASGIVYQGLLGLHAAHNATTEKGEPLNIVHRDVSPQNLMVGVDGTVQVLDFGVAKAAMRVTMTQGGQIKGKVAYMAPEQFAGGEVDRRLDVFAAGIVLWEALTGQRLFGGRDTAETVGRILLGSIPPVAIHRKDVPPALESVVQRALSTSREQRFATALDFAKALDGAGPIATTREISEWVIETAAEGLDSRAAKLAEVEANNSMVMRTIIGAQSTRESSEIDVSRVRSRTTRRVPLVVVGALVGAGVMAVVLTHGGGEHPLTSSDSVRAAGAVASDPTAPAISAVPPAASAASSGRADASERSADPKAEGASPPVKASAPVHQPMVRPRPPSPPQHPRPSKGNCSPPYTLDAQGIKRLKPYCF